MYVRGDAKGKSERARELGLGVSFWFFRVVYWGFLFGIPVNFGFRSLLGFLWIPIGLHWIFLWFVLSDKVRFGYVWPLPANAFTLRMVTHT